MAVLLAGAGSQAVAAEPTVDVTPGDVAAFDVAVAAADADVDAEAAVALAVDMPVGSAVAVTLEPAAVVPVAVAIQATQLVTIAVSHRPAEVGTVTPTLGDMRRPIDPRVVPQSGLSQVLLARLPGCPETIVPPLGGAVTVGVRAGGGFGVLALGALLGVMGVVSAGLGRCRGPRQHERQRRRE